MKHKNQTRFNVSKKKLIPAHEIELIAECKIWKNKDVVCLQLTTEPSDDITNDDIALLREAISHLNMGD